MIKNYVRYNETTHDFVDVNLAELRAQSYIYNSDNSNIWDVYRNITGVVEYWAWDVIRYTIFHHYKIVGISYEMQTDDQPMKQYYKLKWYPKSRFYQSYRTKQVLRSFEHSLPNLLLADEAISFLNITENEWEFTLKTTNTRNMWAIWQAKINNSIAYGNTSGEAIVHAFGINEGIWGADNLKDF